MSKSPFVSPVLHGLDWETLRFPGEAQVRDQVDSQPSLKATIERWTDPMAFPFGPAAAIARGMLLATPSTCPAGCRLASVVRQTLQLEHEPELYLFPSQTPIVELLGPSRGQNGLGAGEPFRLAVGSRVFEQFLFLETLFLLGRKIGQGLLGQIPLMGDPSTGTPDPERPLLQLRGLWKLQELSGDRFGLLCCQNLEASCRSLLKCISGLGDHLLRVDLESFVEESIDEETAFIRDDASTFVQLRLLALRRFYESDRFRHSLRVPPARLQEIANTSAPARMPEPTEQAEALSDPAAERRSWGGQDDLELDHHHAQSSWQTDELDRELAELEQYQVANEPYPNQYEALSSSDSPSAGYSTAPGDHGRRPAWTTTPEPVADRDDDEARPTERSAHPTAPAPTPTQGAIPGARDDSAAGWGFANPARLLESLRSGFFPAKDEDSPAKGQPTAKERPTAPPPKPEASAPPRPVKLAKEVAKAEMPAPPTPPGHPAAGPATQRQPLVSEKDPASRAGRTDQPTPMAPMARRPEPSKATPPLRLSAEQEEALRDFAMVGSIWVVATEDGLASSQRKALAQLFGADSLRSIEQTVIEVGRSFFPNVCRRMAITLATTRKEVRRGVVEDILNVALGIGKLSGRQNDRILDLASMLGLGEDDLVSISAKHEEPEFSRYPFRVGDSVEVHLDGEWLVGTVQKLESDGDLRVHFTADDQIMRLSPKADLIRPQGRAGKPRVA